MNEEKLHTVLAELKQSLTELYGERLDRLILYGSQARGDAAPDSDIDVLVVLRGKVDPLAEIHATGKTLSDLSLELNAVISPMFVSVSEFELRQSPLLINVRREGIAL